MPKTKPKKIFEDDFDGIPVYAEMSQDEGLINGPFFTIYAESGTAELTEGDLANQRAETLLRAMHRIITGGSREVWVKLSSYGTLAVHLGGADNIADFQGQGQEVWETKLREAFAAAVAEYDQVQASKANDLRSYVFGAVCGVLDPFKGCNVDDAAREEIKSAIQDFLAGDGKLGEIHHNRMTYHQINSNAPTLYARLERKIEGALSALQGQELSDTLWASLAGRLSNSIVTDLSRGLKDRG